MNRQSVYVFRIIIEPTVTCVLVLYRVRDLFLQVGFFTPPMVPHNCSYGRCRMGDADKEGIGISTLKLMRERHYKYLAPEIDFTQFFMSSV